MNGAYRYTPLALPLGELSPKVTERVLHPSIPSPSSLRSATSPKGRGKGLVRYTNRRTDTLHFSCQHATPWLSLWESCRRRRLRGHCPLVPSPSSLRSATSPRGRGKGCPHYINYTGTGTADYPAVPVDLPMQPAHSSGASFYCTSTTRISFSE